MMLTINVGLRPRVTWLLAAVVMQLGCIFQDSELVKAVRAKNVDEVRRLLDTDTDWSASIYGAWEISLESLNPSEPRTFEIVKLIFAENPQPKVYGLGGAPTRTPANSTFRVTGRNITGKDRETTPVEIAAHRWSPETVRFLLDNGLEVKHESVQNALVTAASNGCEPIIQMLLDAGADVNGQDKRYDTALAMARRANNHKIAELLLARGAKER